MAAKIQLRKTSLVDFPGCISSVFFFPGCNLRCPWCHNRELILGSAEGLVDIEEGLAHIRKRQAVLSGVVLSGGEPCLCEELPDIIEKIKKTGNTIETKTSLKVKLDTNGMFPVMLEKLLSREETKPDYIALDLKIAPSRYEKLAPGTGNLAEKLIQSAAIIRNSGIAHEYRTLALPSGYISENDINELALLADTAPWYFRPFHGGNCLNPEWDSREESAVNSAKLIKTLSEIAGKLGKTGIIVQK